MMQNHCIILLFLSGLRFYLNNAVSSKSDELLCRPTDLRAMCDGVGLLGAEVRQDVCRFPLTGVVNSRTSCKEKPRQTTQTTTYTLTSALFHFMGKQQQTREQAAEGNPELNFKNPVTSSQRLTRYSALIKGGRIRKTEKGGGENKSENFFLFIGAE